uniref:Uncharacterized protein n=1 Tax=Timema bartmani TaxID=61472 RepID=A0A7R9EPS9_9NEOP|nr:unnamed protein product [Timema bartmani]
MRQPLIEEDATRRRWRRRCDQDACGGVYRSVCLLTAGLAFLLGLGVGLTLSFYLLPAPVPVTSPRYSEIHPNFLSVSFVNRSLSSVAGKELAVNGIYWSPQVEARLPPGYGPKEEEEWHVLARSVPVLKVEEGCGRIHNRLLTLQDGSRSCCRYRQNTDQIQGEVFSYYLARLLGLRNLPPAALSVVRYHGPVWAHVQRELALARWAEERVVVLTRFIPSLRAAHIPLSLRTSDRHLHPTDVPGGANESHAELAQWSDLVVLDYLTANLDRVVNNLYNLQWNPAMMDAPAHNLARDPSSGLLLFLDNESGLLHGYRLLDKYEHFHASLLRALCVFRRSTADVVRRLHLDGDVGEKLQLSLVDNPPEVRDLLPPLPERSVKILNERIARVHEQISWCEGQYGP